MSLNTANIIHIVVEVVTLLSITVYFLQQNRKMMDMIDSLSEQMDEQEEKIKKHDKVIADILKTLKDSPTSSAVPPPIILPSPLSSMFNSVLLNPSSDGFPSFFPTSQQHQQSTSYVEEASEEQFDEDEEEEEEIFESVVDVKEPEPEPEPEPMLQETKITDVKKKKKKKKKTSTSSNDIDKELEDELNELYKEEIMKNNT